MAYNILLVDDSDVSRAIMAKALEMSGLDLGVIHQARHGLDALKILKSHWLDIVLADINMPVMGGMEMVENMEKDGMLQSVPVVIVSTEGSATRMAELMAKGVRAYVRKPFTPEQLRDVVLAVLGGTAGGGSAARAEGWDRCLARPREERSHE